MSDKAIRAKQAFPYSLDGITVKTAGLDEIVMLRAGAADALVIEGYADHAPTVAPSQSTGGGPGGAAHAATTVEAAAGDDAGEGTPDVIHLLAENAALLAEVRRLREQVAASEVPSVDGSDSLPAGQVEGGSSGTVDDSLGGAGRDGGATDATPPSDAAGAVATNGSGNNVDGSQPTGDSIPSADTTQEAAGGRRRRS